MARAPRGDDSSDPAFDPPPVEDNPEHTEPGAPNPEDAPQPPKPGDKLPNPAEPLAPTVMPEATTDPKVFLDANKSFAGYPKTLYHPVHGGVTLESPNDQARLLDPLSWFSSPELADAARTATEAWVVGANNMRAKLAQHDEAGHPIVRNSVAAHEAIKAGSAEPL